MPSTTAPGVTASAVVVIEQVEPTPAAPVAVQGTAKVKVVAPVPVSLAPGRFAGR